MKSIRSWLVARFYPGTLEEFYAAREIQRREQRTYIHRLTFIVGFFAFLIPMLIILFSGAVPLLYKILLFVAVWGVACIRETITEHYSLQLLRRDRGQPKT
jgi:polyferredoxin